LWFDSRVDFGDAQLARELCITKTELWLAAAAA